MFMREFAPLKLPILFIASLFLESSFSIHQAILCTKTRTSEVFFAALCVPWRSSALKWLYRRERGGTQSAAEQTSPLLFKAIGRHTQATSDSPPAKSPQNLEVFQRLVRLTNTVLGFSESLFRLPMCYTPAFKSSNSLDNFVQIRNADRLLISQPKAGRPLFVLQKHGNSRG
jgi:hypothetical protein